jgi:hypothetical protein
VHVGSWVLMIRAAIFLTCLALASCEAARTREQAVVPGVEFVLAPGATASLADREVTVRFVAVTEDSRCPLDTTCVWAGEVRIQIALRVSGADSGVALAEGTSAVAGGYRVTLSKVEPRPVSTAPIVASDYRATLTLTRAPAS